MQAYEQGGFAYHATMPTDSLTVLRDVMAEAALAFRQWAAVEASGHVQHWQQCQANAGIARSGNQRLRHRSWIRIWLAVRCVMQVMELADAGVTRFQHLDV